MVSEFVRITVLWEELWMTTLHDIQGDAGARISRLKHELQRVSQNKSLSHDEKTRILGENRAPSHFRFVLPTHPLYTIIANIFGTSFSKMTMRPNPRREVPGDYEAGGRGPREDEPRHRARGGDAARALVPGDVRHRAQRRHRRAEDGLSINHPETILVDVLCRIQVWSAKCLK